VPCQHHTVAGAARTPVESTVVVYDGSNWRHKLIRPIGGSPSGHRSLEGHDAHRLRPTSKRSDNVNWLLRTGVLSPQVRAVPKAEIVLLQTKVEVVGSIGAKVCYLTSGTMHGALPLARPHNCCDRI
jgi:hypothetical protein